MARGFEVVPEKYFSGWRYDIKKAHWPALGVVLRTRIDQEKTKVARAKFIAKGGLKRDEVKIKHERFVYVLTDPVAYDFKEGDFFHLRGADVAYSLQVVLERGAALNVWRCDESRHCVLAWRNLLHG